ncbi:MAG: putative substrate-binding component of transporter [Devosia sp.]|uniref:ABC transporter substrate-binding protein n=1 Tax=Devosia sp. TaxID=1871048 RepID=UPI00260D481D|nr:sugar ABC transporter substrate-binding protein [Devosia sp.]MDB5586449.1 putative substrate-binding component of transporter [Devosia sp.]
MMKNWMLMTTAIATAGLMSMPVQAEDLNLWVRTSSAGVLEKLADLYNASHDDKVVITGITAEQMVPKLGASIAAGAAPDGAVLDLIYLPTFAATDSLEDLTDFIDGLPYAAALSPSHIRLATFDGKKYGVPALPDASIIAYNKDLFAKAGLDPEKAPASLAEIAEDAKKITALGNDTYGLFFVASSGSWLVYDFTPHIWAAGADILSEDGRTATIDTPAMRATLAAYNDMWKAGAIHPTSRSGVGNDAVAAFASGKVGVLMTGSYIVNLMTSQYPDVNFGVAAIPGPDGGASSFAGGDTLSLMKGISPEKKAVAESFIDFYMQPEQQVLITKESGMPPRTDLAKEAYGAFDPRNLVAYDILASAKTPYTYASDELFVARTGPWVNLLQSAIFDGKIDEAIAKAQADFTRILDRTNPK